MLRRTPLLPLTALVLTLFLLASPGAAQSTGVPVFQAPYRAFANNELAFSYTDPGQGYSLEGSYRVGLGKHSDGGLRGGILVPGDGLKSSLLLGFDARLRLIDHTESFPLDGSLTLGAGFRDNGSSTAGYLPIGFSMGRRFFVEGSSTSLVAYVQPTLTPMFADASGTAFTLGFGLDIRLTPRLDFRFSGGIGDLDGIGLGVAILH